ncbi:hypothetical protein UFOVP236_25 [uncultured Caudovirales phage]|uniref:Uncharacterized protein n=1 Tax=uncultured Caudovirales phage TaxID=2100421 RepID=A0A6J7WUE6_9CAUD|nr:hypothetical protein UFOVP236_25 [uncultured Caudovirales phage]
MTQGIKIYGPQGQLWMDSTLVTWNLVEVFRVEAGQSASRYYADLTDREFLAVQIPLEVPKVESQTYEKSVSASGGSVSVSGGNQAASIVVMCR